MKVKHITEIAIALMLARWKQTLVAAIGVTFSIAFFISLLGFMEGLNELLDGMVLNRTPHVRLYNDILPSKLQPIDLSKEYKNHHNFISSVKPTNTRKEIYNAQQIINQLNKDERVIGVAPKITAQVFYNLGNIDLNGIINGVDTEKEAKLFSFSDYVIDGDYKELKIIPNSIILGKGAADIMMAKIGDIITVTSTEGEQFSLKVIGFFQSGIADIDKVQSYASLSTTQKILGENSNYISDIQIKLKDIDQAPALAREYGNFFKIDAEDIQTANAQFETGSSVRSIISYAVGITLLIVSGFGIYNILNMLIYEKMDTIAILKATGFAGADVKKIFITISMSIGIAGALAGLLFGFLLSLIIDAIPFHTSSLPTVTTYPINYGIQYYSIAAIFALATTYLAGWLPARKASKVDPVLIIRGK
ncbi:ABC transporter permease [Aequorivita antarctica]|uniref:ABC transporter permease n=1 Tax=Aequorivita antarctica TaxID=153266 RepID=A0A5C6YYB0_9FLAO|nr:FtsX-like permease family protein [Aequorivita antarctica]TXD72135.1 ABC transporter permease [Aequorivita antarctica]SRX75180.1 Lipoprotein-releasing system transmembrane protein LolE [Aequorivita antarctica]